VKARRHHARDRSRAALERDQSSDDRRIGAELAPQRVGDHCTGIVDGPPAGQRRDAEILRQRGSDKYRFDAARLAGRRERRLAEPEPAERVEARGPLCVDVEIRRGAGSKQGRLAEARGVDRDEPITACVRQRREQHGMRDREDRGRRGGARREGKDRQRRDTACTRPGAYGRRE
jgi:hypothetical protein